MTHRQPNIQQRRSSQGFTLIELLLVLVILTALTAIVAPKFSKRSKQARVTAARVDISQIELAIDTFEIDNSRLPTTNEGLNALVEEPANVISWQEYLKRGVPKDPWGNLYVYTAPGKYNTNGYDLHSLGPDKKDGGDDDINNWSQR